MNRLEGKTALITGGNSGIGRAIAAEFANQGAKIAIFGRNQATLDETRGAIGNGTLAIKGDVTNLGDLDKLYQETSAELGKLDILVVNAGIAKVSPLDQTTEAFFDQTNDINFKGAFFTVQKALPYLNDGASIILVSSIVNTKGFPGFSVYAATKAALRSLSRSWATELSGRNIRVNTLSPGPIETPIYDRMGLPQEALDEFATGIIQQVPLGRFGTSEEMAKAALFLASDDSSYIQGSEISADGGIAQV
ncbi:MAG: SDR family oxidoreductase [Bacteroidota bacterium]